MFLKISLLPSLFLLPPVASLSSNDQSLDFYGDGTWILRGEEGKFL